MFISTKKSQNNRTLFLYQQLSSFYEPAVNHKNLQHLPLVDGIIIKLNNIHAFNNNIISREESFKVFCDQYSADINKTLFIEPSYDWPLCHVCATYFSQTFPMIISFIKPQDIITQQVVTEIYSDFTNQLKDTYSSNSFQKVICSYGNCYSQTILDVDPYNCPLDKKDQRQEFILHCLNKFKSNLGLTKQIEIQFAKDYFNLYYSKNLSEQDIYNILNNSKLGFINDIFVNAYTSR